MKYALTIAILAFTSSLFAQNTLYVKNSSRKWPCRVSIALGLAFPINISPDTDGVAVFPKTETKIVETPVPIDGIMYSVRGAGMTTAAMVEGSYIGDWVIVLSYSRKLKYWRAHMVRKQ